MKTRSSIYILTNDKNTILYIGVTSNLVKRIWEHKNHIFKGFTQKYNVHKLVYYETFERIEEAIIREKQLKGGSRKKKEKLINECNPEWKDLYENIV
ncbi:MAG TPA: GIY-YIG nuclease family protein [Candidatus Andersenbacteria bacterium]|nr:GIY-YIG nuclease family protein [Candidatus Andersenbacteria bacterium]